MSTKVCIGCGGKFIPVNGNQHRCKRSCGRVHSCLSAPKPCLHCGKDFRGRVTQQKFCSLECNRTFMGAARSMPTPCVECGQPVLRINGQIRKFHDACRDQRRVRRAAENTKPELICAWCQEPIVGRVRTYCSQECSKRAQTARKHVRRRGIRKATPIPVSLIHSRDHGRCQLCRRPVSLRLSAPHPRSATLDHIIPLSRGGEHSRANVQLAHYGCNSSKGNRATGEQLRLLG